MTKLFSKMIDRLQRLDQLIRMKATGQPHELARRLKISPSTLYGHLEVLKNVLKAPVKYCHTRRSYVYDEEGRLFLGFKKNDPFSGR
ncbi:MAG: hypothetical protein HC819_21825 [Cyclobacteriaceae bacterium]|nr:hypothetical protein [Cyclobacteriaceae bacterium]